MLRVKVAAGTTKKAPAKVAVKKRSAKTAVPKIRPAPVTSRAKTKPASPDTRKPETVVSEAQDQVVAAKFARPESGLARSVTRPTLPGSYGESHLLVLVRDPQTLFAAWDVSPSTVEGLKARIGARALAVSTLTLRLFREGGIVTHFHIVKRARSRYIKIDGNSPSFVVEIGFTTPSGRFELIARSAPCFVPMGLAPRAEGRGEKRRVVIGYREARALARRALLSPGAGARGRLRKNASLNPVQSNVSVPAPRVLGGASDLHRR